MFANKEIIDSFFKFQKNYWIEFNLNPQINNLVIKLFEITIKTQLFLFNTFIVCCLHQIVTISYSKMIKLEVLTLDNHSDLGLESLNFARLTLLCLLLRIVLGFRNSFKGDR